MASTADINQNIAIYLYDRLLLGTIIHDHGALRFFGLTVTQSDDNSIIIDDDDKQNALEFLLLSPMIGKAFFVSITPNEGKAFILINCSMSWLWITASSLCSLFFSLVQQPAPQCY